jgi:cobalt/nickel transport system permease protein
VTGLLTAVALLLLSARVSRGASRQSVAYRGALGALLLAAMSIELPLGPLEYHLSLVGPVGVLLGPAASFQVVFVASAILAFAGHGGFTVVGLNALVLGAGAALARPLYRRVTPALQPPAAMELATALGQAVSGALWLAVVAVGLGLIPGFRIGHAPTPGRAALFGGIALPLWAIGIAIEAAVAFGIARFLARVRPDLLPEAAVAAAPAPGPA